MTTSTKPDDRPLLERARSAMRGLAEIEAALSSVGERLRQARSAVRPEDAVLDVALGAVLDGDPVPADLADRVLKVLSLIHI